MDDFKDMQRPNGQLPGVIPSADWGFDFGSGPAWDSALFIIPWNVYKFTGDISLIKRMWQNMLTYMDYMSRQADDYICDYGLADWCSPIDKPQLPAVVTDTAYYYHNAILMSKMSDLMGEPSDKWMELSQKIRKAWREKFLNNEEYSSFQTFYACAIYQGLLNEDEIPVFAQKLAKLVIDNGNHIDCGILGTKYIFTALAENGYMDLIYKMITNPTCPSYAYWINKGYKTLCESWDIHDSCNHHMFGEVDNWFYKYLGGIDDDYLLLPVEVIEPIQVLKTKILGNHNPRLHSDETLIALTISATSGNSAAKTAMEQLDRLRGCEAHSTVILSQTDKDIYKKLGISLTCEPRYQTKKLYHK